MEDCGCVCLAVCIVDEPGGDGGAGGLLLLMVLLGLFVGAVFYGFVGFGWWWCC